MIQGQNSNGFPWRVEHVDELPVELLEGVKLRRVLRDTGFDAVGCEYVVMEPGQTLEPHVHERAHAFILIIAGHGLVVVEGRDIAIGPGHLIYIPPGVLHGFRTLDEPVVLYGFQSPPIIQQQSKVDLLFEATRSSPDLVAL